MEKHLLHARLTESIIGAAIEVANALRVGLSEKVYENAMVVELQQRGHRVDQQKSFAVRYKNVYVGSFVPDLIVDDSIIVDAKVVEQIGDAQVSQMIGYLAITELRVALLINFKHPKLDWKRIVR